MNDSLNGKNGKIKVMYVRSESEDKTSKKGKRPQNDNKRTDRKTDHRKPSPRPEREAKPRRPRENERSDGPYSSSPWKTVSMSEQQEDHGGISGKSQIDPEQLRRQRAEETRVYGVNSCLALFEHRPECLVRAWFVQSVTPKFREALRWMAANKKAYHVVDDAELAKASGTEHHGGVCFLIKKRHSSGVSEYLLQAEDIKQDCIIALDDVSNPHNLGAIMRTGAHFGVKGVLLRVPEVLESGAAIRTAEGGAEFLQPIQTDSLPDALQAFRRAGYTIVTTSSHKGTALTKAKLPQKMVLVVGHESEGLSEALWKQGDLAVSIDGSGHVESLNVSVATAVLMSEWWRQRHS